MGDALHPATVDIDGSGSLVSNVSTFTADPKNFTSFVDCITDIAGRIRKRPGKLTLGSSAGARITALHEYVFTDPTTGAVTYWRFRTFGTTIQYNNAGVWATLSLPYTPTSAAWVFTNWKNRVLAVNGADAAIVFDGTSWRLVGQDGPPTLMTYSLIGTYSTGTVLATININALVGTGTTWDFSGAWTGKFIDINGVRYTIANVSDATHMTLTENFKEASGAALTYVVHYGVMDWDISPKYAYAYYNPTTGHCSNIRTAASTSTNVMSISEQSQVGVTPQVTIAGGATNTTAFNAGYTQFKIFRTPKNGNVLVAINTTVNNNNSGSAIVYTETSPTATDTALTTFEAPLTINRVPPTGLVSIIAHQGRVFAISRVAVFFCAVDPEVSIGVSEECWPARFTLPLAEPLGLVSVGGSGGTDSLIIQTNRGNYSIDGFDVRTYYAYVLPNRRSGSAQGNATGINGTLVTFYRDHKLVLFPRRVALQDVEADLGTDIQNKLNTVSDTLLRQTRVHRFANQDRDYLLLSVPKTSGSTDNDYTFIYDRDKGGWYEWNVGFTAFATVHNSTTGALELWAGDSAGNVHQLLGATFQDGGGNFAPTFTTSLLRPFGSDLVGRLAYIKAFVSDGSQIPTGNLLLDEQATPAAPDGSSPAFTLIAAAAQQQNAQGRELRWVPSFSTRNLSDTFQFTVTMPSIAGDYYFDKLTFVFEPAQDIPARV